MAGTGEQRAKPAEAVGDDLPRGDKLGQRLLDLRRRRCVPSIISSKKDAPFSRINSATFAALALTGATSSARGDAKTAAALRGNRLMGVDFNGAMRLPFDLGFAAGPSLAQATRPERQASSSSPGA